MASGPLEEARALHEDMERLERLVVADYKAHGGQQQQQRAQPLSHLACLAQAHRVRRRLDGIQEGARKLLRLYEDADGARREEIAALAGGNAAQRERLAQQQMQQQRQAYPPPPPPHQLQQQQQPEQEQPQQNGGGGGAEPDAPGQQQVQQEQEAAKEEEVHQAKEQQEGPKEEDAGKKEDAEAAGGGEAAAAPADGEQEEDEAAAAAANGGQEAAPPPPPQEEDGGDGAAAAKEDGGDGAAKEGDDGDTGGTAAAMQGVEEQEQEEAAAAGGGAAAADTPPPPPPPPPQLAYPPPPPRPMPSASAPTPALAAFYARLAEVRDYHARFPSRDAVTRDEREAEAAAVRELPDVPFSGEEARGRCVDMHALHAGFLNFLALAAAGTASAGAGGRAAPAAAAAANGEEEKAGAGAVAAASTPAAADHDDPSATMDYLAFLDALREWGSGGPEGFPVGGRHALPRARRLGGGGAWRAWCAQLEAYLRSFHARTRPLVPLEARLARVEEDLREAWAKGQMPVGWGAQEAVEEQEDKGAAAAKKPPPPTAATPAAAAAKGEVDVDAYESPQQLADAVGGDALKRELASRGFKIGGTPLQRAERLWAAAGKAGAGDGGGGGSKKNNKKKKSKAGGAGARHEQRALDAAIAEARARWLLAAVAPQLQAARARAERRAAFTADELEQEALESAAADEAELKALAAGDLEAAAAAAAANADAGVANDEDDDEERMKSNPLKLPMGWDGRPIPYWLYKLHGLNQEFSCEVCGGHTYRGRREYERHFREARHALGMRALGLPNTREFHEVTRVEDALALGRELEARRRGGGGGSAGGGGGGGVAAGGGEGFQEELEDAQGNVFDRRTYELLARQGLV